MILIQPPTVQNWNSLINKPSILSDNQISWDEIQNKPTTLAGYGITNGQPLGNELTALQDLSDSAGFLKKTGNGTYSIDSNTYLPLTGGTLTGNLSITGSLIGTGAGVGMYETSPLGTVAGNTQLLGSKTGLVSNIASERTWIRRRVAGTDWQTTLFHNGITVDVSFGTPGVDTRAWWERDIQTGSQSWGNANTTFFSVDSSRFHIPLATPSTSTTTGAITAASLGITGAIFAGTLNGNGSGLTTLNASNLSSGAVNIARIPTGTTSTTVSLGDHTHAYLPLAGGTLTGQLGINNTAPTITFQDTDGHSAFIHVTVNKFYILRGDVNATSWTPVGGVWPLEIDLTNNNATFGGNVKAARFVVGTNQVVSARRTGWAAPTGTATRATFATSTVTLPQLAERVKGLIDDLTAHGLIGA